MADGPACFMRGFPCPALLRIRSGSRSFSATGLLPPTVGLSRPLRLKSCSLLNVLQPRKPKLPVWAPPRSLAATDGITCCFLFLRVLRCFSSPGVPPCTLWIQVQVTAVSRSRVPPFGHPRIDACLRLPEAFRRSPRPSSAPGAQASSVRSFQLNLQGCSLPFAHAKGALRSFRYPVFKEQRAACFSGTSYLTTSAGFASTALRGSNCQQMGFWWSQAGSNR